MTRRAINEWAHDREGFSRALIARHVLLERPLPGAQLSAALGTRGARDAPVRVPASTLLRAAAMPAPVARRRHQPQPYLRDEAEHVTDGPAWVSDDDRAPAAEPGALAPPVSSRPASDAPLELPATDRPTRVRDDVARAALPPQLARSDAARQPVVARPSAGPQATSSHIPRATRPATTPATPPSRPTRPATTPATPPSRPTGPAARRAEHDAQSTTPRASPAASSEDALGRAAMPSLEGHRAPEQRSSTRSPELAELPPSAPLGQRAPARNEPTTEPLVPRSMPLRPPVARPISERPGPGHLAPADRENPPATRAMRTTGPAVPGPVTPQRAERGTSLDEPGATQRPVASSMSRAPNESQEHTTPSSVREQPRIRPHREEDASVRKPVASPPAGAPLPQPARDTSPQLEARHDVSTSSTVGDAPSAAEPDAPPAVHEVTPSAAAARNESRDRGESPPGARETATSAVPDERPVERPVEPPTSSGPFRDDRTPRADSAPNAEALTRAGEVGDRSPPMSPPQPPLQRTVEERSARRRPTTPSRPASRERTDTGVQASAHDSGTAQRDEREADRTSTETPVAPLQWLERLRAAAAAEASRSSEPPPAPEIPAQTLVGRVPRDVAPRAPAVARPTERRVAPARSSPVVPLTGAPPAHVHARALSQTAGQAPPTVAQRVSPASPPVPLRESTRAFLRPLVGIDPREVRVHQGDAADRLVASYDADAITTGDDVMLAAGHDETSPEGLGLLAHELTHVARRSAPQFVPPIARGQVAQEVVTDRAAEVPRGGDDLSDGAAPDDGPAESSQHQDRAGEERVALATESLTRDVARRPAPSTSAPPLSPRAPTPLSPASDADDDIALPAMPAMPIGQPRSAPPRLSPVGNAAPPVLADAAPRSRGSDVRTRAVREREIWNGLPAPWDPLPAMVWQESAGQAATEAPAPGPRAGAPAADTNGTAGVMRADRGRAVDASADRDDGDDDDGKSGGSAGDVDAIARKVYDLLRRRLAAERRRGF